jgi:Flp pilus assembly CpaE family ATPase
LHVLASPATTNFSASEPLKFDRLTAALESARQAYIHTVIDAPRLPTDVATSLVAASNCALLVFQLTVKDLRTARSIFDSLIQRGIDTTAIFPVANRFARRQMIGLDEAAKALGGNVPITAVRNDYSAAIQGLNYGQTLSQGGPRSNLRKDLQDLIAKLRERKLQA